MPATDPFGGDFLERLEVLRALLVRRAGDAKEGLRVSPERGGAVEFRDFRNYAPGDDLRYVDWNLFGRLGKLFVKEFARESESTVYVLLDASASMTRPSPGKYDAARRIAAALAYLALAAGDAVTLAVYSADRFETPGARRDPKTFAELLDFLRSREARGASAFEGAAAALLERAGTGGANARGAVAVISDLWVPVAEERALSVLRARRFEPGLVQVLGRAELAAPPRARYRVTDSETGEALAVELDADARARYAAAVEEASEAWQAACRRRGLAFVRALKDEPFERVVRALLAPRAARAS